jgi:hypothetical protein
MIYLKRKVGKEWMEITWDEKIASQNSWDEMVD